MRWGRYWNPGKQVAERARLIADRLGETRQKIYRSVQGEPPLPPSLIRQYEDHELRISDGGFYLSVELDFNGEWVEVFRCLGRLSLEVTRYNYSADWVGALNELWADLKSKERRAQRARFENLDREP